MQAAADNAQASRRLRLLLVGGLLCANLLVLLLAAYSLNQSHRQYQARAEVLTQNIAGALNQNLVASVDRVGLALRSVADELEHQLAERGRLDPVAVKGLIARHERRLPEVEAFRIADVSGGVIIGRGVDPQAPTSWADREYFVYHRDHADDQLQVARPRMGRVAKTPIIGFSVRYNHPDGRFAGVISAPIAVEHFSRLLHRFNLGSKGVLVMRDTGFGLIARVPALADSPAGQVGNVAASDELRRLVALGTSEATYRSDNPVDGIRRTYTYHRLANLPMIVVVGVAEDDYLAGWHGEVFKTGIMAGGFLLLSVLLGLALLRQLAAGEKREQLLAASETRLSALVEERTAALHATEARASHILNSSADGLFGVDQAGRLSFVNPAACAMLGYRPEQLIGRDIHPLIHHSKADGSPYPAADCPSLRALANGATVRVADEVYWHADGHPVPVMYATHPIVEGGVITGSVTSFVDVSAQRAAAQAREQALLAAEQLARIRREFIANVSHEMRTPLNGILGFADIGLRNVDNPEKVANAFSKIAASGKSLLATINDLLDFSSLESDKLKIVPAAFDIRELVTQAVANHRARAAARHLELRVEVADDLPARCLSDPVRLAQILNYLLANAVKFSENGRIALAVAREGEMLSFRISDTGIGMIREQLEQLFNPFHQADMSNTRRFGGTGLSLAICKRLIELLDGTIVVASEPGSGSVFTVRLPYVAAG